MWKLLSESYRNQFAYGYRRKCFCAFNFWNGITHFKLMPQNKKILEKRRHAIHIHWKQASLLTPAPSRLPVSAQCITIFSYQPASCCHILYSTSFLILLYFPLSELHLIPLPLCILYNSSNHLICCFSTQNFYFVVAVPPSTSRRGLCGGISSVFWVHVHLDLVRLITLWCMLIEGIWGQMRPLTGHIPAGQTPYSPPQLKKKKSYIWDI